MGKPHLKPCLLSPDTMIMNVLSANPELTNELLGKGYTLAEPSIQRQNLSSAASLPEAGCDSKAETCGYTCELEININDSPFREVIAFGSRQWVQADSYFYTTKQAREEHPVAKADQLAYIAAIDPLFPAKEKLMACAKAAEAALHEVPECNSKRFYKYSGK
ncbi:MAG: hypothetical protein ACXWPM_04850 [Bdellovibrionota bacterium]